MDERLIRRKLARWYDRHKRSLPWRETADPHAIWISEIMLQQTRVAAVIPYYQRFLARYPDAAALAQAPEEEVLTLWSGLGYYSRARNLQKAARQIVELGAFPPTHAGIRALAGVGDYTAAAVASIAFGLPHAVVDGNVRRVIARITNGKGKAQEVADLLLDRKNPSRSNQALMELGATVCVPRDPHCGECPIAAECEARKLGTQNELPEKRTKPTPVHLKRVLLVIKRKGEVLLAPSTRVQDFWDLPEPFEGARIGVRLGEFSHTITHRHYRFTVHEALARATPESFRWFGLEGIDGIPLSTTAKKGLLYAALIAP
ncbi:MAG: A/G-specific adenine glycosylase [Bryobacteraceae bacterium]